MLFFACGVRTVRCHNGQPPIPDFSLWNTEQPEELRIFCGEIPVCPDEILSVVPRNLATRQAVLLPSFAEVQISLESIYAPPVYTVLQDYFVVIYVFSGHGTLHVKGSVHEMDTGSLAVLPPGMPYYISCTEKDLVLNILSLTKLFFLWHSPERPAHIFLFSKSALWSRTGVSSLFGSS